jgi:hypothetical protein
MALNRIPFCRWTLRGKAAQCSLALRWRVLRYVAEKHPDVLWDAVHPS